MSIDFKVGDKVVDITNNKVYYCLGTSRVQKGCYIFEGVKDSELVGHTRNYIDENIIKVESTITITLPRPLIMPKEGMFYLQFFGGEWIIAKSTYIAGRSLDTIEETYAYQNFLCFEDEKHAKIWRNFLKGNYYE